MTAIREIVKILGKLYTRLPPSSPKINVNYALTINNFFNYGSIYIFFPPFFY